MTKKRIEVLVFEGCPNVDKTVQRARTAADEAAIPVDIDVVRVRSHDEAVRTRFLGSPTVRVDGVDVDPASAERSDYALQCRVYASGGRLEGAPPVDWIASCLRGYTNDS